MRERYRPCPTGTGRPAVDRYCSISVTNARVTVDGQSTRADRRFDRERAAEQTEKRRERRPQLGAGGSGPAALHAEPSRADRWRHDAPDVRADVVLREHDEHQRLGGQLLGHRCEPFGEVGERERDDVGRVEVAALPRDGVVVEAGDETLQPGGIARGAERFGAVRMMLTKEPVASPSPSPSAVTTSARAATSGPTVGSCDFQRYDRSVRPLISATIAPTRSTPKGASGRRAGADPETRVVVLRRSGVGGSRVEAAGGRHTAQIVNPASTHTISDTQLSPKNCSVLPASEPARATSASIVCAASRATNTTIAAISAPRRLAAGHDETEHEQAERERQPRPAARTRHPVEPSVHDDLTRAVPVHQRPLRDDRVERAGRGPHRGRRRRSHPVHAMVVPAHGVRSGDPMPPGRRRSSRALRDLGNGRVARARAVEIGRRRPQVLVHAARPDTEVGLVVIAENGDVGRGPIRELDLVAEVDDAHGDAGYPRRDRLEGRAVVGRSRPRRGVRRSRRCVDADDRDGE